MRITNKEVENRESKIVSLYYHSKKKVTQKVIAKALDISTRTVKRYIRKHKINNGLYLYVPFVDTYIE